MYFDQIHLLSSLTSSDPPPPPHALPHVMFSSFLGKDNIAFIRFFAWTKSP